MNALLEALKSPGTMTGAQWLMVGIIVFVLLGSIFFVYRLYRLIENERRSKYVPNIGRKRLEAERRARGAQEARGREGLGSDAGDASDGES